MGKEKYLKTAKKKKSEIAKLLSERMSASEIAKELCGDHQKIKNVVKNITKLRTWSLEKVFKNLLLQDEGK